MIARSRMRWLVCSTLALLAFAQASIALAGCLGARTVPQAVEQDGCALSMLLCRAHCQAQDQTLDSAQTPGLDADVLAPALTTGTVAQACVGSVALPVVWRVPLPAPPPYILFGRLLI